MAWVELKLQVSGETQLSRAFEVSARHIEDMREPLAEVGHQILGSVNDQFLTEGGRSGAPWKPLSPRYAAWKARQVGELPILVFSGRMHSIMTSRNALTIERQRLLYAPQDDGGPGEDRAQVAAWHQAGAGHNPKRKIVDLTSEDKRGFERAFASWIRRDPLFSGSSPA